ncbi:MAG: hypothetical protein ACPGJV_00730 [Bacteriovoracaceae bacterium]
MLLSGALKNKKMDVRLLDKHLSDGKISRAEYEQYINELTDDTNNLGTTEELKNQLGMVTGES